MDNTKATRTATTPLAETLGANVTLNMRGSDAWLIVRALREYVAWGHTGVGADRIADALAAAMED